MSTTCVSYTPLSSKSYIDKVLSEKTQIKGWSKAVLSLFQKILSDTLPNLEEFYDDIQPIYESMQASLNRRYPGFASSLQVREEDVTNLYRRILILRSRKCHDSTLLTALVSSAVFQKLLSPSSRADSVHLQNRNFFLHSIIPFQLKNYFAITPEVIAWFTDATLSTMAPEDQNRLVQQLRRPPQVRDKYHACSLVIGAISVLALAILLH